MSAENKQNDPGKCMNWKAWIDAEPPGRRLHVSGKCIYPSAGWTITLKKHEPAGINKAVLILARSADPPRGQATQVETTYDAKYEQKLGPDENYNTVTIMPDNVSVKVTVAH